MTRRWIAHRLGRIGLLAALLIAPAVPAQSVFRAGFEGGVDSLDAQAARLLSQASFGATVPAIAEVRAAGLGGWIDQQLALPPSRHLPFVDQIEASGQDVYQNVRIESWFRQAQNAPDQLRQRTAYALSQIFVISDRSGALEGSVFAMTHYYDLLLAHAFGNYRELLEAVTLHPAMGVYLSMLGNQKASADGSVRPDENYAREIMQLFSIGLVMLDAQGNVIDGDPGTAGVQPVPSYDQESIRAFARVFTGWKWKECENSREDAWWEWEYCGPTDQTRSDSGWRTPMRAVAYQHDAAAKTLLSYSGVGAGSPIAIPAGGTAQSDLEDALDTLANHPNVGPFIARQLIQRLVTSNPSPQYIGRVAAVFNNDGQGQRGNLGAVVRAILLDAEARDERWRGSDRYGKLREPLLRKLHLWRALRAASQSGRFYEWGPEQAYAQAPLRSPSVFNFYQPSFQPAGEIQQAGLVAPEFQITTDTFIVSTSNDLAANIYWAYQGNPHAEADSMLLDHASEEVYASNPEWLIDRYDLIFMSGQMPPAMRSLLIDHVAGIGPEYNPNWRRDRVSDAINLIMTSAQYAVQR